MADIMRGQNLKRGENVLLLQVLLLEADHEVPRMA
jgi:hypothetical protein